jgi:hypothetical protein
MPTSPFDYRVCAGTFDLLPLVSQRLRASAVQLVFFVFSQWLRVSVVGFGFALEVVEHVPANFIRKLIKSIE